MTTETNSQTPRTIGIKEACRVVLGEKLANSMLKEVGIAWTVVSAMSEAKKGAAHADAVAAINAWRRRYAESHPATTD